MVPSLQIAEITANNLKWAKINTGPYGQPPLKIKILKNGLRNDRCRPKRGLQPTFHETWIFGGGCAAARLRRVCNHPAFGRKSKFWKSVFCMSLGVRKDTYCPNFMALSLQMAEIIANNRFLPKWAALLKKENFENPFFAWHSGYKMRHVVQISWSQYFKWLILPRTTEKDPVLKMGPQRGCSR